jgi:1,4-alpha-glucan branching enzyme
MTTPILTPYDLHLFAEGTHYRTYEKLGAHPRIIDGVAGVSFASGRRTRKRFP